VLQVHCQDYLATVREFAKEHGLEEALEEKLDWLKDYCGGTCVCDLYKDFAPQSFGFTLAKIEDDGRRNHWFTGGLIYQGPDSPGDGSYPALSVSLTPGTGWQIHT
jgi:hypothetical protein